MEPNYKLKEDTKVELTGDEFAAIFNSMEFIVKNPFFQQLIQLANVHTIVQGKLQKIVEEGSAIIDEQKETE